jgi:DNA-binding transcriptional ArsR family regulator
MAQADAFVAMADPTRRYLLETLKTGGKTVNELAEGLPVSRPAVSQHLKILLDAGMVDVSKEGTRRIYCLRTQGFLTPNIWLDQFWNL